MYYITGVYKGKYGICDTDDCSVEFVPLENLKTAGAEIQGYDRESDTVIPVPNVYLPYERLKNSNFYDVFNHLDECDVEDISSQLNCDLAYLVEYNDSKLVFRVFCDIESNKTYSIDGQKLDLDVNEGVLIKLGNGICTVLPRNEFNKINTKG